MLKYNLTNNFVLANCIYYIMNLLYIKITFNRMNKGAYLTWNLINSGIHNKNRDKSEMAAAGW